MILEFCVVIEKRVKICNENCGCINICYIVIMEYIK